MPTQTMKRSTRRKDNPIIYQRPLSISPWAKNAGIKDGSGTVWISMKPSKINDQYSKGAGTIGRTELNTEFLFLAPLNLNENIVHHWEAYESVASRLAQKARSAIKLGNEVAAMGKVFSKMLDADNLKNVFSNNAINEGLSVEKVATRAYNSIPGSKIPNIKIDTPLYYTNSERRQIVFEFQLFNENIRGTKPEDILVKPIQDLMKYSSPDLISDIQIEFPYMWEVKTLPIPFINYTTCALIGVQPTWNSPYVNHIPASCNLQLTFMDLSPLYAGTIEYGSIINVITGKTDRFRKAEADKASKARQKPMQLSASMGVKEYQRARIDRNTSQGL